MTTDDKFGGDYDKLLKSYNELQALVGKQSTQITDLHTQYAQSQTTIQELQKAKSQLETDSASGSSLYDWANGRMRTETGAIDPGLIAAMERLGATPEQTAALVENVEYAQTIVQEREQETIGSRFGTRENYDAAMMWAKDNLDPSKTTAINTLLSNRATINHGLDMLKAEAANGGLSFTKKAEETPANEPGKLPPNTGGNVGGPTPLKPNTPEAMEAMKEAFASKDPAKVAEYEARLIAGQRSG